MRIINRQISELIPADYNPRQLTKKQFEDLKRSIEKFGEMEPAVINMAPTRANTIISGHQRIQVAKKLGKAEYPCIEVDLPIHKEQELNVRMNKNTGEWDLDGLANNFNVTNLFDWGFEEKDFDEYIKPEKKETTPKIIICPNCGEEVKRK